jgi:hypothetical protein
MLFGGNKRKELLQTKGLVFSGPQNKLVLERKKRQAKRRVRPGNWKLETRKQGSQFPVSDFQFLLLGAYLFPVEAS